MSSVIPARPSQRQIPLLDLVAQHAHIREEILAELLPLIDSQRFIMGPQVGELECELAGYLQVKHAIGCASGSDALLLAWMALGIQPGDKIITTPYSFFASASSISRLGAIPVFVDIARETFNLDTEQVKSVLEQHGDIKAIQPVHLFGGSADMGPLLDLGRQYGIPVVEDAAQAIGAEYRGARCGSLGTIGCFSFYPGKNLGGYGDGGLLTTNDDALADRLRILRVHGGRDKYYHQFVGINSRLDTLQAAVLKVKLRYLDEWTGRRQANAKRYWELLKECPGLSLPQVTPYQSRHVFNQYTVLTGKRDELKTCLAAQGIGAEIYYPLPLHLQECFTYLGYRSGQLPVAESCAQQALSLPVHPELDPEDLEYVAHQVQAFLMR